MQWRDAEQRNEKRIDAILGRRSSGTAKQTQGRAKAESAGTGLLVPLKNRNKSVCLCVCLWARRLKRSIFHNKTGLSLSARVYAGTSVTNGKSSSNFRKVI